MDSPSKDFKNALIDNLKCHNYILLYESVWVPWVPYIMCLRIIVSWIYFADSSYKCIYPEFLYSWIYNVISDSPYCGSDEPQIVGVALLENAELPCDVVSNPKKLVFHWSFNNSADGTPLTSFNTNGSRWELILEIIRLFTWMYNMNYSN